MAGGGGEEEDRGVEGTMRGGGAVHGSRGTGPPTQTARQGNKSSMTPKSTKANTSNPQQIDHEPKK